ncbi:ATP-dependent 6-phosphofructokinase [Stagnimonas aquatica]|uniref:ATP-dependent 6-phosphofructokinase n=1 Tax=Stagnimonas aquatica TaxID=2689987 RepID=A0A3N0UZQ3_9GAMM|nr:ATP-dependent 6-phosphofructokinase [Stagnimonas aquatica]ROH86010.1 ATP-dependent 6-phosphofructokinase [Stagnimonas aquatica]
MKPIKTLGVLTSGGDCAGLNAAIRAVALHARQTYGLRVLGILDGTLGLMDRPLRYRELHAEICDGRLLREGGTVLGTTNRGDPFHYPMPDGSYLDRSPDFAEGVRELGLDALIVIGGDGSMRIVSRLCAVAGIGMVGIPKTIDNDVHGTEYAVGFSTAVNVVVDALDRLQPTAASHHRVMVLETMGRDAGHIALNGGIAGGADVILIPELPYTLDGVARRIREVLAQGRSHALVVVAEGVRTEQGRPVTDQLSGRYGGIGQYLVDEIAQRTGVETRATILGHVQRGGTPSARDRILASSFGVRAVELAAEGRFGSMVAWQDRGVVEVPMSMVTVGARAVAADDPLIQTARGLGVYVGEA